MKNIRRFFKAQFMVVYTLVVAVLLGAMGLSIDMAVLYVEWGRLQKAADAGALAGAGYLTGDPKTTNFQNVIDHVNEYVEKNGIAQTEIAEVTPAADARSVKVLLIRSVPYYFFRLIGLDRAKAAAMAVAGVYPTAAACGILPFGVQCTNYVKMSAPGTFTCKEGYTVPATGEPNYQQITLKNMQVDATGNWAPLDLNGTGSSGYRTLVADGYPQMLKVGESVTSETGNVVGPTRQGLADRMNGRPYQQAPANEAQQQAMGLSSENPQVVLVPLVDWTTAPKGGRTTVPILDFMTLFIAGVTGNDAAITAVPIEPVAGCGVPITDPGSPTGHAPLRAVLCPDSGCPTIPWWPT